MSWQDGIKKEGHYVIIDTLIEQVTGVLTAIEDELVPIGLTDHELKITMKTLEKLRGYYQERRI